MSTTGEESAGYRQVQLSPEFGQLRTKQRSFVFPMSLAFLLWYLSFILLASYAPDLMAIKVVGQINLGLLLGLLQFVSTFAITTIYVHYANRHLDPAAERISRRIEGSG